MRPSAEGRKRCWHEREKEMAQVVERDGGRGRDNLGLEAQLFSESAEKGERENMGHGFAELEQFNGLGRAGPWLQTVHFFAQQ